MAPKKIGRYEIKGELGRGGMATVYHAYDPRFERDVAVKVLPREFLHDPQFRLRFEREARTIARLEHPAIVPVHDYGDADGQLYLVMRLMVGGSLSTRLRQGPLALSEVARIFGRLAPALDAAHAKGIIHRDLKPDNILFDQWGEPHLSDFGIAKLVAGSKTALTATGGIVGTPAYMSPEQVRATGEIDGRSDIYALGVILFEMLTGQQPYKADTPIGLAVMHLNEPVPLVERSNPDLPPACQRLVDHAMAKDRDKRPDTATDLAKEISRLIPETGKQPGTVVSEPGLVTELWRDTKLPGAPGGERENAETPIVDAGETGSVDAGVVVEAQMPHGHTAAAAELFDVDSLFQEEPAGEAQPMAATEVLEADEFARPGDISGRPASVQTPMARDRAIAGRAKPRAAVPRRLILAAGGFFAVVVVAFAAFTLLKPGELVLPSNSTGEGGSIAEFIDQSWQSGFQSTNLARGKDEWVIVVSKGGADGQQTWRLDQAFPSDYITSKWEESYNLSDLAYGEGQWLAMMSKRPGGRQTWRLETAFPEAYVNQKWDEGFNVSSLAYGAGQWAVVMTLGSEDGRQSWRLDGAFPEAFIGEKWAEGYAVTSLAYGGGQWAVVMSQGNEEIRQTWRLEETFPRAFVEEKWAEEFDITNVAYGAGQWAVVMSQGGQPLQQTWHMSRKFN